MVADAKSDIAQAIVADRTMVFRLMMKRTPFVLLWDKAPERSGDALRKPMYLMESVSPFISKIKSKLIISHLL